MPWHLRWLPSRRGTPALPWSPSATNEEVRAYVQDRLALFSRLMFLVFWVLMGFVLVLYEVYPYARPARADVVHSFAIIGLIVMSLVWYFALVRQAISLEALYAVDLFYSTFIGAVFGMCAYFQSDRMPAVYVAFIYQVFTSFMRAIVIPSSGLRTAVVSSISFVPMIIAGFGVVAFTPERIEYPEAAFVVGVVLMSAIATTLAAFGSRVIYGLRRQVSEARQLGQYTLDERIGVGGMGSVYRARHALLRRPTAIKLVSPDKYGADNLARLEREVQHMSQLTHPNTVAIYDYGKSPGGVFYYVMEYLDGVDLERLVALDGPQPAARVIHVLRQVCGALDEAHGRGLTHRDIKPANVILCRRGNQPDVAKVLDFGLARELAEADDRAGRRLAGTPAYLAPEVVTDPSQVGPPADLYSLGATAYFLLTGHRVFTGTSAAELCVQHATAVPTPPSQRTDNPIPTELEALVLSCLAKRPAERPASAAALRDTLADLPTDAWDEATALAWWHRFEARPNRPPPTAVTTDSPTVSRPLTITIDLDSRD